MPRYAQILTAATVFVAPGLIAQSSRLDPGPRLIPKTVSNPAPKASPPQIMQVMNGLPLVFEPNLGQTGAQARYITRASGMTSFLTDRGSVMVLSRRRDAADPPDPHKTPEIEQSVVRMELEGSRAPHYFEGLEKVESISNYFIGNVPSEWVTNVPNYRKVRASGVYPGIDLVYYGDGRKLEYDFVVRPGANPGSIHLTYEGADSLTTDQDGNLLIATGLGTLVQHKPLVYQEINGERRQVQASYSIRAGKVDFALANWDRRRALVIDPVLEYSTYLGGTGADRGNAIALDGSGKAYVTGYTSGNFPVTGTAAQTAFGGGSFDAFVTKLNPSAAGTAALVYTTYLGGAGSDYGFGIAVDAGGAAYVTGATASIDFPTTHGVFQTTFVGVQNAFVTKLNASGSALVFSTYLGGSGTDQSNGIALDASGEAYVTGYTNSADFPTMGAPQTTIGGGRDAFVTKLNEAGSALEFSTYLGGKGDDQGLGIALDASGEAYVTGNTASTDFPTMAALQMTYGGGANDAFVTKLHASGSVLYSTYLGGNGDDQGRGIAVDSNGLPYVTGQTTSTDFPTTSGAFQPTYGPGPNAAFVTKLSALGYAPPIYSTYLGPTQNGIYTQGMAIAVNASGEAYVTGQTNAANFPTTSTAPQATFGGGYDVFVTKMNASGSTLAFSTYLGGLSTDQGFGIALDSIGAAYVTGFTDSVNFPVTPGAYQTAVGGSSDAFVTKLNIPTLGPPAQITVTGGGTQSTTVGTPFVTPLQAKVTDAGGNGLPGVSVTFTVPASGPSATFAATPTVVTDSSGVATAPILTANGTAGSFAVIASAAGLSGQAVFSLTNLAQSGSLRVNPSTLSFASQINQAAPPGQTVQVSSAGAALSWTATPSAPWITVSPSTGNTPATATISVNPAGLAAGNYSGSVVFSSPSGGTAAVLVTYTVAGKPTLAITPPDLVFTTSSATVAPPPQTLTTASSAGPISYSVTAQVATPTGGSWLKVSTSSGQTGGSVQVSVDLTGLSQGIYTGSVSFTPADSTINSVSVPVVLLLACGQGGCTGFPATILSVANGASFHPGGAPGAAMTIFGTNLADAVYQATTFPLPTQLGPTSVTVNGNPVPLFYASPTQINFQMPFGAPVGSVQVAVTNGSTRATGPAFNVDLAAVAPALFINPGNRAAALNQDFSANTPSNPVGAGGYILLFMTGQGPLSPPLAEGVAAPTTPLSLITGTVQVSIGGQPAQVSYAGVAPGFAGLAQINAIVPAGLAAGDQPVFVTVNGVPSNAGLIAVTSSASTALFER